MPNIHINCKKPKSCDTCQFNEISLYKFPEKGWCVLLQKELKMKKIKKREKECPFNKKETILKTIIKEIKKCLKPKKKPKSLTS